jgi:ABC-type transporter Mla subunit MlaD
VAGLTSSLQALTESLAGVEEALGAVSEAATGDVATIAAQVDEIEEKAGQTLVTAAEARDVSSMYPWLVNQ